MYRMQRLFASSNVRFFKQGEVSISQLTDIVSVFQEKHNVLADHNTRKRLERAGEPIWHCVLWYDYVKIGHLSFYLFTTGYSSPKSEKKAFDVSQKNAELVRKEGLKDIYNGDHLTFGRYILGQYIDYESPYDKRTTGYPKEHRHPEMFKDMLNPKVFNYARQGEYYNTLQSRLKKLKSRYATEQHQILSPVPVVSESDLKENDLHTEMEDFNSVEINNEIVPDLNIESDLINTKTKEFIAADKLIKELIKNQHKANMKYASYELRPKTKLNLINEHHPNFRTDIDYAVVRERLNNQIRNLHSKVERISREDLINQLSNTVDIQQLYKMSHKGLKELWVEMNKRRVELLFNRLCEDRTRTVRWTWYVRKKVIYDINQEMKYAIKHMGRGGNEFVRKVNSLYKMVGFHGVRYQVGVLSSKFKREAKHAFPKVFKSLSLPKSLGYVTTIPITITTCKQFHDECITASIKNIYIQKKIKLREEYRDEMRKIMRQNDQYKDSPIEEIDHIINENYKKQFIDTIKVDSNDLYEFLRLYEEMNPKHTNFTKFNDLDQTNQDKEAIFDFYEIKKNQVKLKKPNKDDIGGKESPYNKRKRVNKSDTDNKSSETI